MVDVRGAPRVTASQAERQRSGIPSLPVTGLAAGVLAAVTGLVVYAVVVGHRVYASTGNSYPGALTAVAEPVGYFLAAVAGAVTFGGLLYVVITAHPDERGVIDERPFRTHLLVEWTAAAWAIVALVMVAVQAASDSGASVWEMLSGPYGAGAIGASPMARAWIVVAVVAVIVAVVLRGSLRWISHAVLLVPGAIGVIAIPVSGNAAEGPNHDHATSAAIVLAVAAAALVGIKIAAALDEPSAVRRRRVLLCETVLGAVALCYGAALLGVLLGSTSLTDSTYGWAAAAAGVILLLVWAGDVSTLVAERRGLDAPLQAGRRTVGAAAMVVVLGLVAAMATQPAPGLLNHRFTTWDVFLGYELPSPPSVLTLLTTWRFDSFLGVAAIVLAGAYAYGVVRLRRRGDGWPTGRLVAWSTGCLVLLVASSSGVKAYGSAMFSVHMAEHMTLNMFVPVLLVMGGPVTLALRVLPSAGSGNPPGPREWVLWLVHSKFTAFVSHPVVAFLLFVASLYAVYFTPAFDTLVRYHWGHELMSLHFLLVGYLFYWGIIGIDPGPKKLPFLGRLGLLFAVMPFHAFFGIATMTMTTAMGGQFYRLVDLPWLTSIQSDQHLGGAIAWGSSELPVIIVVVALVAQWARQDRRAATRSDRHSDSSYADDDLDAYNAMLRELARDRG